MSIPTIRLVNGQYQIPYQRDQPHPCAHGVIEQHLMGQPLWEFGFLGETDDEEVIEDGVDYISCAGDDSLEDGGGSEEGGSRM
jgi:hypothetical protein